MFTQCSNQCGVANCYKCFVCNVWVCEDCDLVHTCQGCGGTYCFHCRPCQTCADHIAQGMATQPHPNAQFCECGSYLDLAGVRCEECHRLDCLGTCERKVLTNYCCHKDKCRRCSFWHVKKKELKIRVCCTCPLTSDAVLKYEHEHSEHTDA